MQPLLSATTVRALTAPVETSLGELLSEYGLDAGSGLLLSIRDLRSCLDHFGIGCSPPFGHGGLDEPRVIFRAGSGTLEAALKEIAQLETSTVEFKSSLQLDRQRLKHDPGKPWAQYRAETVIMSALKTVAAFANSGGGTLYLGVEDDGTICGLEDDYKTVGEGSDNFDGWDLHFRNLIRSRFTDGDALNAYVVTTAFCAEGREFVRVKVAPRKRLTFLKKGEVWELYRRFGTQTNAIPYRDVELHFILTPLY